MKLHSLTLLILLRGGMLPSFYKMILRLFIYLLCIAPLAGCYYGENSDCYHLPKEEVIKVLEEHYNWKLQNRPRLLSESPLKDFPSWEVLEIIEINAYDLDGYYNKVSLGRDEVEVATVFVHLTCETQWIFHEN